MKRRNIVGDAINYKGLMYGPVNENGVIFLFSKISEDIGIKVETVRTGFPDCVAKRRVKSGFWEELKIEFEFKSSDFKRHGHNPDDCDMIVCWEHDWQQTPKNLEVFELKKFVEEQTGRQFRTLSTRSREATPAKIERYFDTIICPAQRDGFEREFLGKNKWWPIRLRKENIPKLNWIAAYQIAPTSAITHVAKIKVITPYKNTGKYVVYFDGKAKRLHKIPLAGKRTAVRGPWFTTFSKLKTAKSVEETRL